MSDDVRRLARGAGVLLPATLVGNALLLGLDFTLNGLLGNADYGAFNAIRRVLGFLGFFVLLGLENAVIRYAAEGGQHLARRALGVVTSLALATTVTVWVSAPFVAAWVDPSPDTALALRIAALSLPLAAVRLVAVALCQGRGDVRPRAVLMFLAWPLAQLLALPLVGGGLVGAAWAYTLAMALGAVGAVGAAARGVPSAAREIPWVELRSFAWPLWMQGLVMAIYTWVDQVLLAALRTPEEAGIYGPVATLAPLYGLGLGALNGMFAPMIAQKFRESDMPGMERLYRTVTRWALLLALLPAAISLARPDLVIGLWPNGQPAAEAALRITVLAQLVCTAVGSVNYLLIMAGHQRLVLWNGIPGALLNLGASILLIPRFGVLGAALANAFAMVFANVLAFAQVRHYLKITPFRGFGIGPGLAAGVVAGLLVLALPVGGTMWERWLWAGVAGAGGTMGFVGTLTLLGIDDDDRVVLNALWAKLGRVR